MPTSLGRPPQAGRAAPRAGVPDARSPIEARRYDATPVGAEEGELLQLVTVTAQGRQPRAGRGRPQVGDTAKTARPHRGSAGANRDDVPLRVLPGSVFTSWPVRASQS